MMNNIYINIYYMIKNMSAYKDIQIFKNMWVLSKLSC